MPFVKVTSSQEGFRRGGRAWSKAPTYAHLSEEAFELVDAEPMLTVATVSPEEFQAETGIDPEALLAQAERSKKGSGKKAAK